MHTHPSYHHFLIYEHEYHKYIRMIESQAVCTYTRHDILYIMAFTATMLSQCCECLIKVSQMVGYAESVCVLVVSCPSLPTTLTHQLA